MPSHNRRFISTVRHWKTANSPLGSLEKLMLMKRYSPLCSVLFCLFCLLGQACHNAATPSETLAPPLQPVTPGVESPHDNTSGQPLVVSTSLDAQNLHRAIDQ